MNETHAGCRSTVRVLRRAVEKLVPTPIAGLSPTSLQFPARNIRISTRFSCLLQRRRPNDFSPNRKPRTTARLRRDAEQHASSVKETLEAAYADRMAAALEKSEESAALLSTAQKKAFRLGEKQQHTKPSSLNDLPLTRDATRVFGGGGAHGSNLPTYHRTKWGCSPWYPVNATLGGGGYS